ncbi:phosphatase PAP2 family protein [Mycolicibacterium arenosum]|uniref:Phosphatase PAP2 family protein n=1 Tax=Mycolicibacterium arenosum TaxID=2952157 RepID=A0ABT1LZ91_9MYCO|nr:phosphatase PAP2 family protein [Mycolicibacterium sp. CAU 1645]MCP9272221.1 phosphatase PAP2 family protein [Mycolicibacterium sp. CAU 1645]
MSVDRRWLIATAVLAAGVYAATWIGWSTPWPWVASVDDAALRVTHGYGVEHPTWVLAWDVLCSVFSPVVFRLVTLGVIVWAAIRRKWRLVVYLAVAVEMSGLLTEFAKGLADRARPDTALVGASSSSFPSGHALGNTAIVLSALVLVLPLVRRRVRPLLIVLGAAIVLVIGVGRVVLNVHHPSDVVAGWALGYVWFVVTLALLPPRPADVTAEDGTRVARGS